MVSEWSVGGSFVYLIAPVVPFWVWSRLVMSGAGSPALVMTDKAGAKMHLRPGHGGGGGLNKQDARRLTNSDSAAARGGPKSKSESESESESPKVGHYSKQARSAATRLIECYYCFGSSLCMRRRAAIGIRARPMPTRSWRAFKDGRSVVKGNQKRRTCSAEKTPPEPNNHREGRPERLRRRRRV